MQWLVLGCNDHLARTPQGVVSLWIYAEIHFSDMLTGCGTRFWLILEHRCGYIVTFKMLFLWWKVGMTSLLPVQFCPLNPFSWSSGFSQYVR